MVNVSDNFKAAMKEPVKEIQAFINYDEGAITDGDDLISYKISCDSGLCKSAMRKLEAKYLGSHNLLGKWVKVGFGVRLSDGSFDMLDYGSFLVTELTESKDTETTSIVAYDKMVNSMTPYQRLDVEYPVDLLSYTNKLCGACNLTLVDSLGVGNMNEWQITAAKDTDGNYIDLWENIEGITYRDIFVQIAQATGSTCIIHDDKVYFKPLTNTGEELTYDNMFKLKLEALYGEINSVVLSRTPSEDNIFLQNEASVETNGLTEFKIENNEIIDKDRENAITPIFEALSGISYYPFEATTEGLGWYEIGDSINIKNDAGDVFNTSLFNYTITIDGSVKETLKTTAESKTQTQYQYATTVAKQIQKNTEIIVNKQEQYIKTLVEEKTGDIDERFTSIEQNIENINFNIQNSGGSNLIKNSVMFAYEGGNTDVKEVANWAVDDEGTLIIISDVDLQKNGGISGHGFVLSNKTVRTEKIPVKPFDESNPVYYSFSTKIKKNNDGSCYVRIYNPDTNEEYKKDLIANDPENDTETLKEYTISGLMPISEYYIVEFYGSEDSNATFTDNMFTIGEQPSQWTQASGEVMNTQVNISLDGVVVKSITYAGDYTVISPLEFAGYSNINNTITKVFTLNKGVTEVKELLAKDSISMPPIKIVPVTTGDIQGWAFVIAEEG